MLVCQCMHVIWWCRRARGVSLTKEVFPATLSVCKAPNRMHSAIGETAAHMSWVYAYARCATKLAGFLCLTVGCLTV